MLCLLLVTAEPSLHPKPLQGHDPELILHLQGVQELLRMLQGHEHRPLLPLQVQDDGLLRDLRQDGEQDLHV